MINSTIDKPFHTIKSIGKDLATCKDWSDFLHSLSPNGCVFENDGFEWNANDVCINPHIPVNCGLDETRVWMFQFSISTAKCPCGAWNYGVSYNFGNEGGGWGVHFITDPVNGYPSEKAAVVAGLSYLQERMKGAEASAVDEDSQEPDEDEPKTPKVRALSKKLDELMEFYNPSQPSLFDMEDWQ